MLSDLNYPKTLEYSSDGKNLPIEFYLKTIPHCKQIDLKLGYFSSNAIRALSYGFAQFIFNGGTLRIITNHFLSKKDKNLLVEEPEENYATEETYRYLNEDLAGLEGIIKKGDQHFFNCLKFLHKHHRLIIQPVKKKPGKLAHYKQGILDDGKNKIYFSGSCNFTYNGLVENGENLGISRSWGESSEKAKIEEQSEIFENIFSQKHELFEYLLPDEIVEVIHQNGQDKDLEQLVEDEINIVKKINITPRLIRTYTKQIEDFEKKVYEQKNKPRFPYSEGPRDYQHQAFKNWVANNYQGIFAMATGTGKTITALNCLLEVYNSSGYYQALILVPTKDLEQQWIKEVAKFNIHNTITVGVDRDWKRKLSKLTTSLQFGTEKSFVVISTYASFIRNALQNFLQYFPSTAMIIADEAHNIAAPEVKKLLPKTHLKKRIGLSATPKRIYDAEGTEEMNEFFNDSPPYTYEFSMEEAIAKGILCQYEYFPHLVTLNNEEMEEYRSITLKLVQFFDSDTGQFKDKDAATMLLMKRKRIIHKATNKIAKFRAIIGDEYKKRGNLKYTFVYVPEGFDNEIEDERIMVYYNQAVMETHPTLRVSSFTGETNDRESLLEAFEQGKIDVLSAMKCLDEGVDVPRTELAIFCSSTGNPRQFIQRRGRILRTHIDKKHAVIHDLVVVPNELSSDYTSPSFKMEKSLVENELKRVADFAFLARNQYEAMEKVELLCSHYGLDLYEINEKMK
ncbi:DEAD/DEAH box helicase family protein [Draconibacterium sp. IB214405]|uniref:DEAD/DEAH box helicase family protein n=1 Tax=Draconibacterium sp. IB214405 TaxID=3097352 RepID=UPI002A0CEBBA|nr:DEAD/DEAH box helicase family protein [Draconibacterium sp. IB214405]MDX8338776.1 DEAD/DEAH box helicase family protein [Draconibacterium sp. IB214405]